MQGASETVGLKIGSRLKQGNAVSAEKPQIALLKNEPGAIVSEACDANTTTCPRESVAVAMGAPALPTRSVPPARAFLWPRHIRSASSPRPQC